MSWGRKLHSREKMKRSLESYCGWLALPCPQLANMLARAWQLQYISYQLALRVVIALTFCKSRAAITVCMNNEQKWSISVHKWLFFLNPRNCPGSVRTLIITSDVALPEIFLEKMLCHNWNETKLVTGKGYLPPRSLQWFKGYNFVCSDTLHPPLCSSVFGKHLMAAVCVWPTSAHLTERVDFIRRSWEGGAGGYE